MHTERIDLMKKHEINKVIVGLNRRLHDKQQETYEIQMMLTAQQAADDLKPDVTQSNDKLKTLNNDTEKKKQQLRDREGNIDVLNLRREAINKLSKEQIDLEIENERLDSEQTSLNNKLDEIKQQEKKQANETENE